MSRLSILWISIAAIGSLQGQSTSERDEAVIRALLAENFENNWNNHQPAAAVAPDRCIDDAIFITWLSRKVESGL